MDLKSRITEEGSKAVFAPLLEKFILKNPHLVTIEMQVSISAKNLQVIVRLPVVTIR